MAEEKQELSQTQIFANEIYQKIIDPLATKIFSNNQRILHVENLLAQAKLNLEELIQNYAIVAQQAGQAAGQATGQAAQAAQAAGQAANQVTEYATQQNQQTLDLITELEGRTKDIISRFSAPEQQPPQQNQQ